jgi:hypothetical protein
MTEFHHADPAIENRAREKFVCRCILKKESPRKLRRYEGLPGSHSIQLLTASPGRGCPYPLPMVTGIVGSPEHGSSFAIALHFVIRNKVIG